jgi:acetyl esterase/lipase
LLVVLAAATTRGDEQFSRKEDVIYGRKFGAALTLDVFTPRASKNGLGLIWVASGGWFSDHAFAKPPGVERFIKRGYTVFSVVHASQPKFTIPEILGDMHRAVRFVRYHAKDYGIDPDRLGIMGGSAGGHLSLMQATAGIVGDVKAKDPIERTSSRVHAIACFYPPTDFLNYGKPGENALGRGVLADFRAPFEFAEHDRKSNSFVRITDERRIVEIGKQISPVYHVSPDDPPALIIHGDADKLVPIQQAELIIVRFKKAAVPCKLIVKKGAAHGWPKIEEDLEHFADWFDEHLRQKRPAAK